MIAQSHMTMPLTKLNFDQHINFQLQRQHWLQNAFYVDLEPPEPATKCSAVWNLEPLATKLLQLKNAHARPYADQTHLSTYYLLENESAQLHK